MKALEIYAGPRAREHLLHHGLRPQDVRVVAGAAGGPKGLILLPLDQFIFGQWLPSSPNTVHLMGASIGAWRMACACSENPVDALGRLAHDYIHERYGSRPGELPKAAEVSELFSRTLQRHFEGQVGEVLSHPKWRLQIITSLGRGVLKREGPLRMPLGYAAAVGLNAVNRRAMSMLLRRVVFSAQSSHGAMDLSDLATLKLSLTTENFHSALLASCSIPFWLQAVHDIPGAPQGAHWDGGITDYHMHLNYASAPEGLALIPHFQPRLVPGWLDKPLKWRHGATRFLDNAVVLCPSAEWMQSLPGQKIPDRSDFKRFLHAPQEREQIWTQAWQASRALADDFEALTQASSVRAMPLP